MSVFDKRNKEKKRKIRQKTKNLTLFGSPNCRNFAAKFKYRDIKSFFKEENEIVFS